MARRYRRFRPWMLNGHRRDINWRVKRVIVRGINHGLTVTSTRRGPRFPGDKSWHTQGRAVDMAGPWAAMVRFQCSELARFRRFRKHKEIIGPDNRAIVLRGRETDLTEGTGLETQHDTHVHIAV